MKEKVKKEFKFELIGTKAVEEKIALIRDK